MLVLKKNTAITIYFPILDADGDPVGAAADLDSEYVLDGGNFADCTNEATNVTSGGGNTGVYSLSLVAAETNGASGAIQVKTSTAGAKTTVITFVTYVNSIDDVDTVVDAVKLKTDNLPSDPADESLLEAEINANEAKIDVIDGIVDTINTNLNNIGGDVSDLLTDVGDASASVQGSLYSILGNPNVNSLTVTLETLSTTLSLAAIADAVHDEVTETGVTLRKAVNIILAASAGKSNGGGTDTIVFQDQADTKPRITATVDAVGNRTAITNDGA